MVLKLKLIILVLTVGFNLHAQGDSSNKILDSINCLKADNYFRTHTLFLKQLKFPKKFILPQSMVYKLKEQNSEFVRMELFESNISKYTPSQMLDKIDNSKEYDYIFMAEYWMAYNYKIMIPELIKRLTSRTEIGLINSDDLRISERIKSGDLKDYGHGGVAFDDLFTLAGRASHLLKRTTGNDFGRVSMYSTPEDLKKLQNRWAYWLLQLQK